MASSCRDAARPHIGISPSRRWAGALGSRGRTIHLAEYDPRVRIRPTALEDAEALTDLHLDVWEEVYAGLVDADILIERRARRSARLDGWRRSLTGYTSTELVAEGGDGRLLGFVSVGSGRDEPGPDVPEREVMRLYVRAERYGTGVGYALLNASIGDDPAYLWVLEGNRRAIDFYERQGFRFDGTSKTEPVGVERRMICKQAGRRPS